MKFLGVVEEEKPKVILNLGDLVRIENTDGEYLVMSYMKSNETIYRLQRLDGKTCFTERDTLSEMIEYLDRSYSFTIYPAAEYGLQLKRLTEKERNK